MPTPIVLTLSADDEDLRAEIEQELAPYAEVRPAPPETFDLDEIKLVVEVIAGATGILANGAAVATFLMLLRDRAEAEGKRSGIRVGRQDAMDDLDVALDNTDEGLLRGMLGLKR